MNFYGVLTNEKNEKNLIFPSQKNIISLQDLRPLMAKVGQSRYSH